MNLPTLFVCQFNSNHSSLVTWRLVRGEQSSHAGEGTTEKWEEEKKKYKGSASNKLDSNLNSMHLGMRHGSSAIEHDTLCSKYLYATTSSLNQGN